MEDCRHVTRRFERDLLGAGFEVVRVPTHLIAAARRGGREKGKSDPIDALAAAHAALRKPDLPTARLDGPAREVKPLSDYRHVLVTERTELINRLRWHLHELDTGLKFPPEDCAATASSTISPTTDRIRRSGSPSSRGR